MYALRSIQTKMISLQPSQEYHKGAVTVTEFSQSHISILEYEYNSIAVIDKNSLLIVKIREVSHVSSDSNYSTIHLISGIKIVTSKTLKHWESSINSQQFIRCHNSHLVNKNHVERIDVKSNLIFLINGVELQVARSRKSEVLSFF